MSYARSMIAALERALETAGEFAVQVKKAEPRGQVTGRVQLYVLRMWREPAANTKQRWRMQCAVSLRERMLPDSGGSLHALAAACDQHELLMNKIEEFLLVQEPACEKYVRGDTLFNYPLDEGGGTAVELITEIELVWVKE